MSYIPLSNTGSTPFERLMGNMPEILNKWSQLEMVFFESKTFTPDFLEQIRRVLAFNNLCKYCMAKAGPPDKNLQDARIAEALRLANKFARIIHMDAPIEPPKQCAFSIPNSFNTAIVSLARLWRL